MLRLYLGHIDAINKAIQSIEQYVEAVSSPFVKLLT